MATVDARGKTADASTGTDRLSRVGIGTVGASSIALTVVAADVGATGRVWLGLAAVTIVVAVVWTLHVRRLSVALLPLAVYIAVYLVAALHGPRPASDDIARYLVRPLLAVAIATLPLRATMRRRLIVLIVALAALESAIACVQALNLVARHGSGATNYADGVTGTLGSSQSAVLALLALLAAAVAVAAWLRTGAVRAPVIVVVLALLAGVATSARVVVVLVPVLGFVAAAVVALSRRRDLRTAAFVAVAAVVAGGAVYGGMRAIYPNAFVGVWSSQNANVLAPTATSSPATAQAPRSKAAHGKSPRSAKGGSSPAGPQQVGPIGVQLLPGRAEQLRLAERRSHDGSIANLLLGDGMGTSKLDPSITDPDAVPYRERTGDTWIGRVLTECGWVGLAAFFGLLGWLTFLAWRLWRRTAPAEVGILALAFPVVSALTLAGAAYTTILDVRAYSVAFWVLTGLLVGSAAADRSHRLLASAAGGVADGD